LTSPALLLRDRGRAGRRVSASTRDREPWPGSQALAWVAESHGLAMSRLLPVAMSPSTAVVRTPWKKRASAVGTSPPPSMSGTWRAAAAAAAGDLATLLEQIGCLKYLQVFEEQDVDLRIFLTLTESDLKEIGITLFGPKRKMTSAIARWHSSARPPGDALELAYADRLEAEMQELAIQLHKRCEEVEATRGQVCQEQELRAVVESCLLEQDRAREDLQARLQETWALTRDAALILDQLRACQAELSARMRRDQPPGAATLGLALPPADSKGWQASLQAMSLPELSGAL
ncbi:ANKS3 isoform 26, partial [Pongo abelii]